jgi:hypothetical protein
VELTSFEASVRLIEQLGASLPDAAGDVSLWFDSVDAVHGAPQYWRLFDQWEVLNRSQASEAADDLLAPIESDLGEPLDAVRSRTAILSFDLVMVMMDPSDELWLFDMMLDSDTHSRPLGLTLADLVASLERDRANGTFDSTTGYLRLAAGAETRIAL